MKSEICLWESSRAPRTRISAGAQRPCRSGLFQPQLPAAFQDSFSQTAEGPAEISILSSRSIFWKPCSSPDFRAIWISKSNNFKPSWRRRCLTRDWRGSNLGIDGPLVQYQRSLRLAQKRPMPRCLNGDQLWHARGFCVGGFRVLVFNSPRAQYPHLSLARLALYLVEQFLVLFLLFLVLFCCIHIIDISIW